MYGNKVKKKDLRGECSVFTAIVYEVLKSDSGTLFRVNTLKGVCQVIKDGQQVKNKDTGGLLFPVFGVVFVGDSFEALYHHAGEMVLCQVKQGLVDVPFKEMNRSDVRHLYIQTKLDFDAFPVFLRNVSNPYVSGVMEGGFSRLILVIPVTLSKDRVVKLRLAFPRAIIVAARRGQLYVNPYLAEEQVSPNVRAVDLVEKKDMETIKNPSFAARVYLRNLDFEKMNQLLYRLPLSAFDVEVILNYLSVMIQKSSEVESLAKVLPNLTELQNKYKIAYSLLAGKKEEIKQICLSSPPEELAKWKNFLNKQLDLQNNDNLKSTLEFFEKYSPNSTQDL